MQLRKSGESSVKLGSPDTLIAEGTEIEGKFTFTGTATVNGRLRGEILSNDSLFVGEKGVVNASIRAGVVHISGEVVGDVNASERLELHSHSRVYGDVEAPVVIIEEGALLEGQCRMGRSRPMEPPQPVSHDPSIVPLKRSELPR
jgi:cytoskeletal protein CcmA (bactofilin family)